MTSGFSIYDQKNEVNTVVAAGQHRELVGGIWESIGALQLETLVSQGLRPDHILLDVGCGALRGGIHFIRHLDPNHYYGMDLNEALIEAGYEKELVPLGLHKKLPRDHLIAEPYFDASSFGMTFDRAIAFSLFTHIPIDLIRVCLERLSPVMRPGGILHATFFEASDDVPTHVNILHEPGGVVTHGGRDPFHHRLQDFIHAAAGLPWDVVYVGNIGHPRDQKLVNFVRRPNAVSETRGLSSAEALKLEAGSDHYRAYVGPPNRYDLISASQFALLFQLGLRDHHSVLDFGCGSLRLGRLLIPYLGKGRYYGIDPNSWLIEEGFEQELGHSAKFLKMPSFAYNDDFDCGVFKKRFDFIVAQSIVTHTGVDLLKPLLKSAALALNENGAFVFSLLYNTENSEPPQNGWVYPGCVAYPETLLQTLLAEAGLHGIALPWFHPGASWFLAMRQDAELPNANAVAMLNGSVLNLT